MALKPKPANPRSPIPLTVLGDDHRNGAVPQTYLQSLVKPGTKRSEATARDLRPTEHLELISRVNAYILGAKTELVMTCLDRNRFEALASESLMCNLGSVAFVDPGQIATSYIRSLSAGQSNEFVTDYLFSIDLIFLDSILEPVVVNYLQSNPTAAHYFFTFLKHTKYLAQQTLVLDLSAYERLPSKDRPQISDAIESAYGYATAQLLLENALTL